MLNTFGTEAYIKYNDSEALKITNKLARHFKISLGEMRFYGNGGGCAYYTRSSIRLPHNPSLLLIIEELAHLYNVQKYRNGHHTKKLMKTIGKMVKYAKKKNYWKEEGSDIK